MSNKIIKIGLLIVTIFKLTACSSKSPSAVVATDNVSENVSNDELKGIISEVWSKSIKNVVFVLSFLFIASVVFE